MNLYSKLCNSRVVVGKKKIVLRKEESGPFFFLVIHDNFVLLGKKKLLMADLYRHAKPPLQSQSHPLDMRVWRLRSDCSLS